MSRRGFGSRRNFRGGRGGHHYNDRSNETEWQKNVREQSVKLDIDFSDYNGERKYPLPEEFEAMLNTERTEARDDKYLLEQDLGIIEFVNGSLPGFSGILKHRFSDFVVHEIDKTGETIRLTDLKLPPPEPSTLPTDTPIPEYETLKAEEKGLISKLSWTRLVQLAKTSADQEDAGENAELKIDVSSKSKDERTTFHVLVKTLFPNLETGTFTGEDATKFVLVKRRKPAKSSDWPRDRPKHLTFHLCKQGLDGAAIFGQLARDLRVHNSKFCVAGTKDKRSMSTQKVSIKWVTAQKLVRAVKNIRGRIKVGNFSYQNDGLELGDLKGNKFTIVLRHIDQDQDTVAAALEGLKENGFINYFGQQRFGTDSTVKTSDIGLALLKKNWLEAVELILRPRGNESPEMTRMRAHWWIFRNPGDAVVLLGSRISQSKSIEATLLQGLAHQHDNDFVGALSHLQKNTQLLYIHAYQALIWNKAVSKRIQKFGLKVLVGDLVLTDEEKLEVPEDASKRDTKESRLVTITEDNISQYTIFDVVMPIPGFKVTMPANEELKEIFLNLLAADGLDEGFQSFKNSINLYSQPGDYRHIMMKATDVTWRFHSYDDPDKDILVSDFEMIEGKNCAESKGEQTALVLEFTLPSSTYATMALREAMKVDMGKGNQAKLTESMKASAAAKRKLEEEESNGDDLTKKLKASE